MQYLFKLWDWLNEMLAYPLIQLLAGVLITAFPFLREKSQCAPRVAALYGGNRAR